nr:G protein-coupled receptor [Proales similis]
MFTYSWFVLTLLVQVDSSFASHCSLSQDDPFIIEYSCVDMIPGDKIVFDLSNSSEACLSMIDLSFKYVRPLNMKDYFGDLFAQASRQNIILNCSMSMDLFRVGGFSDALQHLPFDPFAQDPYRLKFSFSELKYECAYESELLKIASSAPIQFGAVEFTDQVRYNLDTCIDFFANVKIETLQFYGLSTTSLINNRLSLVHTNLSKNGGQLMIDEISFNVFNYVISDEMVPDLVATRIQVVRIAGKISKFEPIAWPTTLYLILANMAEFFHSSLLLFSNGTDASIYRSVHFVRLRASKNFQYLSQNKYSFPDEDFCLFSRYPSNSTHFFFSVSTSNSFECSCTLTWLMRNYASVQESDSQIADSIDWTIYDVCNSDSTFEDRVRKCAFAQRLQQCQPVDLQWQNSGHEWTGMDSAELFKLLKYVSVICLLPVISIVSIIVNSLNVFVLNKMMQNFEQKRNEANSFKLQAMYKHMRNHSGACVLLGFLFAFKPVSVCIAYAGPFCSDLYLQFAARLFKLFFIEYVASALFLFSNLSMLWFTLLRFRLNSLNKWRIDSILFNSTRYSSAFIVISLFFALPKLFLSYSALELSSKPFNRLESLELFSFNSEVFNQFQFPFLQLETFFMAVNDVVLPIVIFALDLTFLIQLRALRKAREKKLNIKDNEKNKHGMSKMIAINGTFFLFLRIPNLVATIMTHIINAEPTNKSSLGGGGGPSCFDSLFPLSSSCENIAEAAQVIYQLANLIPFFLLITFNPLFKKTLLSLFESNRHAS